MSSKVKYCYIGKVLNCHWFLTKPFLPVLMFISLPAVLLENESWEFWQVLLMAKVIMASDIIYGKCNWASQIPYDPVGTISLSKCSKRFFEIEEWHWPLSWFH